MGWFGQYHYVKHTLKMYGARFEKGEPVFVGESPNFFLDIIDDNNDVAISDDCYCIIGTEQARVAPLLNSTSYGVRNVRIF